jgi:uncharacterized RDD family membrane protein YckC
MLQKLKDFLINWYITSPAAVYRVILTLFFFALVFLHPYIGTTSLLIIVALCFVAGLYYYFFFVNKPRK